MRIASICARPRVPRGNSPVALSRALGAPASRGNLLRTVLLLTLAAVLAGCQSNKQQLIALQNQHKTLSEQAARLHHDNQRLTRSLSEAESQRQRLEADLAVYENQDPSQFSRQRLQSLARQHPALQYEGAINACKLDADILFDSGRTQLRPNAQDTLAELAAVLSDADNRDLRLVVVGHTDDRAVSKKPGREMYPSNHHLSTARANSVADFLREQGVPAESIGVVGLGEYQPVAANELAGERNRNRRVELYIVSGDVPVIGWVRPDSRRY